MANANVSNTSSQTAIVKVASAEVALPVAAKLAIQKLGVEEDQMPRVISLAIVCGMEIEKLGDPRNVRALHQAWTAVTNLGLMPGTHMYMVPYAGVYSLIFSVNYLQSNVEEHGRLQGISYILQTKPILDDAKIGMYLEFFGPAGAKRSKSDRVVLARYVPVVNGVPVPPADGWETASVGYYLHEGAEVVDKDGHKKVVFADKFLGPIQQGNPGRTAMDVAKTRAIRKASREVTRTLHAIDNSPVQQRLSALAKQAGAIINDGQRPALPVGVDAVPDAEVADDGDGVIDGEFAELIESMPEGVAVEEMDGSAEWVRMTWEGLTPEMRTWTAEAATDGGAPVQPKTHAQMKEWVAAIGSFDQNMIVEVGAGDVHVVDLVLAVMTGDKIGAVPNVGFAKRFYETLGVKAASGKWQLGDGKNIAGAIIKQASAKFVGEF